MERNRQWHWNYCYLRFGTKFSHVQIADLDELVAFNFSKYGNVMSAVEQTEKVFMSQKKRELRAFSIKDYLWGHQKFTRCFFKRDELRN